MDVHSCSKKFLKTADLHIYLSEAVDYIIAEGTFMPSELGRRGVVAFVEL